MSSDSAGVRVGSLLIRCKLSDLADAQSDTMPVHEERVTFESERRRDLLSVDLHGLSVRDAIEKMEDAINQAVLNAQDRIDVIHGLGAGKLTQAVLKHLPLLSPVSSFERDAFNPGFTRVFLTVRLRRNPPK